MNGCSIVGRSNPDNELGNHLAMHELVLLCLSMMQDLLVTAKEALMFFASVTI